MHIFVGFAFKEDDRLYPEFFFRQTFMHKKWFFWQTNFLFKWLKKVRLEVLTLETFILVLMERICSF